MSIYSSWDAQPEDTRSFDERLREGLEAMQRQWERERTQPYRPVIVVVHPREYARRKKWLEEAANHEGSS
jgi:hypothetical protein